MESQLSLRSFHGRCLLHFYNYPCLDSHSSQRIIGEQDWGCGFFFVLKLDTTVALWKYHLIKYGVGSQSR